MSSQNEIIFSAGLPQSNDAFLQWYGDKQVYTTSQQINLEDNELSQEFVTPNGCIGYSIVVDPFQTTVGGDPRVIIFFNGSRTNFPFRDAAIANGTAYLPIFNSPVYPYVEIKDALSFENQLRTACTISIIYYRLKYRDR